MQPSMTHMSASANDLQSDHCGRAFCTLQRNKHQTSAYKLRADEAEPGLPGTPYAQAQ
jgi:hypothetical protein